MRYAPALALFIGVTALTVSAQQSAPHPMQHDMDAVMKGSGRLPTGWKARFDEPDAKLTSVEVKAEKDSLTVTSGPAAIYYKPTMTAAGDYELSATFSQLKPSTHPEAYGLFIAGNDLDKDTQRYTYFLVRQDGKFLVKSRNGANTTAIVDWTDAAALRDPKGVKTSNTLTIRAEGDNVRFLIGVKEVHHMTRAAAGGDGVAGIRVNHNLNVQVNKLALNKLSTPK